MAPAFEIQPWDQFTDISKYGLPTDVQSILDRLQQNVQRYLGNYVVFAGAIVLFGVYFHFSVFFTFAVCLGLGVGAWFGIMNFQPQLRPNSNIILGALLAIFFFIAVKWISDEDSHVIWTYLCFSIVPGLVHAVFRKKPTPIQKASSQVKSAVNEAKNNLK